MSSIAEKIAAMKAAKAAPPQAERGLNAPLDSTATTNATAYAQTAEATVQQAEAQPAKKSAAQLIAEMKAARSAQAAQTPVASVQATAEKPVSAKPLSEYANPVGTPEFEAEHEDLCNATRKLAQELEEEQDGIRYWLDRVHEQLRMQPELVHLLTDSQASALYRGIIARSNMAIVPAKAAKAAKAKSSKAAKVVHSAEDM